MGYARGRNGRLLSPTKGPRRRPNTHTPPRPPEPIEIEVVEPWEVKGGQGGRRVFLINLLVCCIAFGGAGFLGHIGGVEGEGNVIVESGGLDSGYWEWRVWFTESGYSRFRGRWGTGRYQPDFDGIGDSEGGGEETVVGDTGEAWGLAPVT